MITVDIPAQGAVNGHVIIGIPTELNEDASAAMICAIGVSSILFEKLHAKGTNILLQIGGKTSIHVLARQEDDGLDLTWDPKELDPARMDEVQARIRDKTFMVGNDTGAKLQAPRESPAPPQSPPQQSASPAQSSQQGTHDDEDFLAKHLTRVP